MKFGESLATTTPLPRCRSAKDATPASTAGSVSGVGNQLEQPQVARRVEEVRAQPVAAEVVAAPSASRPIGMPDVFELTTLPARRAPSTRSSSARLASSCSTTHSMIQSASRQPRHAVVERAGA